MCARFEAQYGVGSDRLTDEFRRENGTLDETDDFHRWDRAYHKLQAMTASSRG